MSGSCTVLKSAMDHTGMQIRRLPIFLFLTSSARSLVPTYVGPNLLQKLSSNDEDRSTFSQTALDDSYSTEKVLSIFQHSTSSEPSNISPSQSNPRESLLESTTPLEGYFIVATYSGSVCTSEVIAVSSPLNSCTKYTEAGIEEYMKLTATASYSFKTFYSDKECSIETSSQSPDIYPSGCNNGSLVYVSLDGIPPSSSAMASLRFVVTSMTSSSFLLLIIF